MFLLKDRTVVIPAENRHVAVRWIERGMLILLAVYLGGHTLPRAAASLNTDFPNYYLCARLAEEGFDTARVYEWTWLQREKDHRAIDDKFIGLIPITPFSTLVMWPLTHLGPLTAKHAWMLFNIVLLVPLCWMLRSLTGLTWERVALVFALSFPLHVNFLYGQFYLFLLFLIVAACWAYIRQYYIWAGVLVALAAACKIFPVLLLALFLQRRAWKAFLSGVITGLVTVGVTIAVFGLNFHRTYLNEVLSWTLRGEGMPPYVTSAASISSLLHYLLLSEPQWNNHPWYNSPVLYGWLQPSLQMVVLTPAILLIRRRDITRKRILLEWCALLTASLASSTMPASYHFVLMAFPAAVLAGILIEEQRYGWLAALVIAYLGIGFQMRVPTHPVGLAILLYMPRLYFLLAVLVGIYLSLWRDPEKGDARHEWTRTAWIAVMAASVFFTVRSTIHLERAVRHEYAYRMPIATQAWLEATPRQLGGKLGYIAFTPDRYQLVTEDKHEIHLDPTSADDLSFAVSADGHTLVERALSPHSVIVDVQSPTRAVVSDGQDPMPSLDGQSLAFLRYDHGRGQLMVHRASQSDSSAMESALTPPSLNVYEATFLSANHYAFSAVDRGRPPQIYLTDAQHANVPLLLGESRYPSLSPDGRWMAYSHFDNRVWNLWIRDETTGAVRRVEDEPCNQIQPAWEADSKTLLYSTDCGRSLGLTAISRRRVIF